MSDATLSKVERYYRRVEKPSTKFSVIEGDVLKEAPGAKYGIGSTISVILSVVMFLAPIAGASAILSSPDVGLWWNGLPIETAVIAAGVCFAISAAGVIGVFVDWVRSGRHRDGGMLGYAVMTLISAVATIALMVPGYGERQAWRLWGIPAWAAGGLAVVFILLVLVASSRGPRTKPLRPPRYPADAAALGPEETARLLAIRGRVLDIFVEKGLMEPELVERAKQMPLGQLHLLDPEYAEAS